LARQSDEPLSLAEAKERLRGAARDVGIGPWVRRHPLKALIAGATAGFLMGALPPEARESLRRRLLRFLLEIF